MTPQSDDAAEARGRLSEERLRELAYRDPVTGLPNRLALRQTLEGCLSDSAAPRYCAFFAVGISEVSAVEDAFGFAAGDRLLRRIADRCSDLEAPVSYVGVFGLDVFGLILPDLGARADAANAQCERVADEVFEALNGTVDPDLGVTVEVSVNIGYILVGLDGTGGWFPVPALSSAESNGGFDGPHRGGESTENRENGAESRERCAVELMTCAEVARKRAARENGLRRFSRFDPRMIEEAQQRVTLISDLRRGVEEGELVLFAQPIVDRDRLVVAYEGLMRWASPGRGMVDPAEFIPLAEQTGLIIEMGDWAIEEACRILGEWERGPGTRDLRLAINLSERQLRAEHFAATVCAAIERHGIGAGRLELEMTESILHSDIERTVRVLRSLLDRGVGVSLDDFGTGYSSLSYLTQLPVQRVKIDRSFVHRVVESAEGAAIVKTIVDLAGILGLRVTAEGVETEEQFAALRELGADAFQGYLFGRPGAIGQPRGVTPSDRPASPRP